VLNEPEALKQGADREEPFLRATVRSTVSSESNRIAWRLRNQLGADSEFNAIIRVSPMSFLKVGLLSGSPKLKESVEVMLAPKLVLLNVLFAIPAFTQAIQLRGTIKKPDSTLISDATVVVQSGSKTVTQFPEPVLNGHIAISIKATGSPALTCTISAPGFQKRVVNAIVNDDVADLGTVVMQPEEGLSLSKLFFYSFPGESYEAVDVIVENGMPKEAIIESIKLAGAKRAKTECLDKETPGYVFEFKRGLRVDGIDSGGMVVSVASDQNKPTMVGAPKATIDFLPCRQIRMSLIAAYPFPIKPKSTQKLRVRVPYVSDGKSGHKLQALGLEKWEQLEFVVKILDDPRAFSTTNQFK
jgi:hypothetical protein